MTESTAPPSSSRVEGSQTSVGTDLKARLGPRSVVVEPDFGRAASNIG